MYEQKILLGFIRVHILHHATEKGGIYGNGMIKELVHHGYSISPGTLYPILHEMERNGLLKSEKKRMEGRIRKVYTITNEGVKVLKKLRSFVKEMGSEVLV